MLCEAVTGGPVVIPHRPRRCCGLWILAGAVWKCVGLLLDGPEPLLRRRRDDGGLEDRVIVDARSTISPAVPFDFGVPLIGLRMVAGARLPRVRAV